MIQMNYNKLNNKEIEDDQRISDLLKILRERDVADNYADTKSKDNITAENLDTVNILSYYLLQVYLKVLLFYNSVRRVFT